MHVRFQILITLPTKVYFCGLSCKSRPRAAPVRGIPQGWPSAYARNGDSAVTGRDRPLSRMSAFTHGERPSKFRPTWRRVRWQMRTGPWEPNPPTGPCDLHPACPPAIRASSIGADFKLWGSSALKLEIHPDGTAREGRKPRCKPDRSTVNQRTLGRGSI